MDFYTLYLSYVLIIENVIALELPQKNHKVIFFTISNYF